MGWTNERKLGLGACAVVVIAAFLPWAKVTTIFGSVSQSGIDGGDGWITAIAAAVATLAFVKNLRGHYAAAFALGLIVAAVGLFDVIDVQNAISEIDREAGGMARATTGIGLWATFLGGLAIVVMAVVCFRMAGVTPTADTTVEPPSPPPGAAAAVAQHPNVPGQLPPPPPPAQAPTAAVAVKQPGLLARRYLGLGLWLWIGIAFVVAIMILGAVSG